MRKIMMAALFSVVSLSACAVEPQQPEPTNQNVVDTGGQNLPTNPIETQPVDLQHPLAKAGDEPTQTELTWLACDDDYQCESNSCDLTTHSCRPYPF